MLQKSNIKLKIQQLLSKPDALYFEFEKFKPKFEILYDLFLEHNGDFYSLDAYVKSGSFSKEERVALLELRLRKGYGKDHSIFYLDNLYGVKPKELSLLLKQIYVETKYKFRLWEPKARSTLLKVEELNLEEYIFLSRKIDTEQYCRMSSHPIYRIKARGYAALGKPLLPGLDEKKLKSEEARSYSHTSMSIKLSISLKIKTTA